MSRPRADSGDAYVYFLRAITDLRPQGQTRTVSAILRDLVPMWRGLCTGKPTECRDKWTVCRQLLARWGLGGVQWLMFDLAATLDWWVEIGNAHPQFGRLAHEWFVDVPLSVLVEGTPVPVPPVDAAIAVADDPIRAAHLRLPRRRYPYPERPKAVDQLARSLIAGESEGSLAREFRRSVPDVSQNIARWRKALRLPEPLGKASKN